jgi:hypothetical protein
MRMFSRTVIGMCSAMLLLSVAMAGWHHVSHCSAQCITPSVFPETESRTYPLAIRVTSKGQWVTSVTAIARVDGERHVMTASALGPQVFEYPYRMPTGATQVTYSLELDYVVQAFGIAIVRRRDLGTLSTQVANREVR